MIVVSSLLILFCYFNSALSLPRILSISEGISSRNNNNEFGVDYVVSWNADHDQGTIKFSVVVATTGFIGLGISPGGGMNGADIVVGWVDDVTGIGYLEDRHGIGQSLPILDESQDYTLLGSFQNETHTGLEFSRALDTCDEVGDVPITSDTTRLIWSFGLTDTISYHGPTNRGSRTVNLWDPVLPEKPDLSKYKVWEIRTNKTMPAEHTTYWCTMHKSPTLSRKHHIIGFDAILESSAAYQHTHHMEAYKCTVPEGMEPIFESYLNHEGVDCYYPSNPDFPLEACISVAYGWAIGGEVVLFPDYVGFPVEQNEYFKLEVHYDNPELLSGVSFDTGLKLYYTDDLRDIDAGRFVIGSEINFTQTIPPNSINFTTVAQCSPACTQHFPSEGITLFNFLLHSHLSGRSMKVRHFRNGSELPWLAVDNNYDFNFQQTRSYSQFITLYPGDQLSLECNYDTRWKNGSSVIGGHATTDEMCMAFFSYYPATQSLLSCNSEPSQETLLGFLELNQIELEHPGDTDPIILSPLPLRGLKYSKVIEMIDWTPELRVEFQQQMRSSKPQLGYCRPFGPNEIDVSYPDYPIEYKPPNTCNNM